MGGGTPGTTQYSLESPNCNYQHLDLRRLKLALTHWNRPSAPPQPVVILNDRVEADWIEPDTDTDVAGLFARHLGTFGAPAPDHAQAYAQLFQEIVDQQWWPMVLDYEHYAEHIPSIAEYVREKYTIGQANAILDRLENAVSTHHITDYYKCMFKRGESFEESSAKERNIMVPTYDVVAIHGWLNHVLLLALEHHPAFAFHAPSKAALEESIARVKHQSDIFVSLDGSRHDAHQHESLMIQESAFYHRALGLLFRYSGLPAHMFSVCAASICNTRFKVRIPLRDPRARFY